MFIKDIRLAVEQVSFRKISLFYKDSLKDKFHVKRFTCNKKDMPKIFTSKTQKTGEIGENIAEKFLVKHGFRILERNYTQKWGEIDIVAEKEEKLYFIEVKSVERDLSKETTLDSYRPEDNMHPWKLKRLGRAIQTYILQKKLDDREWQFDLLTVFLSLKDKKARVKVVSDIVL